MLQRAPEAFDLLVLLQKATPTFMVTTFLFFLRHNLKGISKISYPSLMHMIVSEWNITTYETLIRRDTTIIA